MRILDNITVMIEPTDKCNLNCIYCHDRDTRVACSSLSLKDSIMKLETLEKFLVKLTNSHYNTVSFLLHGGEFTIAGPEWIDSACKLIRKYYPYSTITGQTNLVHISDELIEVFNKHKVEIGTSYDYLANDKTRMNNIQHSKFLTNLVKFRKMKNMNGAIAVYNDHMVGHLIENYEYSKKINLPMTLNYMYARDKRSDEDLKAYCDDFINLFKHWLFDKDAYSLRTFMDMLNILFGSSSDVSCLYRGCSRSFVSISYDGSLKYCDDSIDHDFKKVDDYIDITDFMYSDTYISFLDRVNENKEACVGCPIEDICNGLCLNGHTVENGGTFKIDRESNICQFHIYTFIKIANYIKDLSYDDVNKMNKHARRTFISNLFITNELDKKLMRGELYV